MSFFESLKRALSTNCRLRRCWVDDQRTIVWQKQRWDRAQTELTELKAEIASLLIEAEPIVRPANPQLARRLVSLAARSLPPTGGVTTAYTGIGWPSDRSIVIDGPYLVPHAGATEVVATVAK